MDKHCPTCGRTRNRSTEQNKRYWLLLNEISEKWRPAGVQYSPNTWHLFCKQRFLGAQDVVMPNGKTITVPHTTTGLDVSEFNDYMTKVEALAAEHGVYLGE